MKFKFILLIFAIFLLSGCQNSGVSQNINQSVGVQEITKPEVEPTSTPEASEIKLAEESKVKVKKPAIPQTLDYPVPFAPQAPYAVWDELHKEACEEAAMIIAAKYFKNESLTAHTMEQAILDLVKWEQDNGYKIDLTAVEARDVLMKYFNLKAELVIEVTVERIKKELAAGNLIIVPAAGRQLGNPYFRTPGPIYHMLVIRGYNQLEFVTNDPGTKRGEGYKYKYQKLIEAIHDWDHQLAEEGMTDEEMEQGRKVMIVVGR